MVMAGFRMTTTFCIHGTNYKDTFIAALSGLYAQSCKPGELIRCDVYENGDYTANIYLHLPRDEEFSDKEKMQEKLTILCQDLPPNTLMSTKVLARFPFEEQLVSLSTIPLDNLSHSCILGGSYDTLVEMHTKTHAEQNMQAYSEWGRCIYQAIKPIYGVQDPLGPSTGLEELAVTHESPPIDWAFFGSVLTDMLQLHTSSCLAPARVIDWLSDGGVFVAFSNWMHYTFSPDSSSLTQPLREQIQAYCDWPQLIEIYASTLLKEK